jgi:phage-related protein
MGGVIKAVGNAVGKVAETVGNVAGKVADVAKGVVNVGSQILNFASQGLGALTQPIKDIAGGLLDKLPFGLGNAIKPLVNGLVDNAASFLSGPVNAGIGLLSKALPTVSKIADFAGTVKGIADQVGALANPQAQSNFANTIASAHAQHIF